MVYDFGDLNKDDTIRHAGMNKGTLLGFPPYTKNYGQVRNAEV